MKTFKNKMFKTRDYEASNIVVCVAENAPNENWIETDNSIIADMRLQRLWISANVQYFGWL